MVLLWLHAVKCKNHRRWRCHHRLWIISVHTSNWRVIFFENLLVFWRFSKGRISLTKAWKLSTTSPSVALPLGSTVTFWKQTWPLWEGSQSDCFVGLFVSAIQVIFKKLGITSPHWLQVLLFQASMAIWRRKEILFAFGVLLFSNLSQGTVTAGIKWNFYELVPYLTEFNLVLTREYWKL